LVLYYSDLQRGALMQWLELLPCDVNMAPVLVLESTSCKCKARLPTVYP